MATKKKADQEKDPAGGDILQKAAKKVGAALGAIAKKTGLAHGETPAKKKIGKLVKKGKSRLPRKEKKLAKKKAAKG